MFKRFNRWYDRLPEPQRFLFFLVALMGWLPLVFTSIPVLWAIGTTWMLVTVCIALSRL